jgi:hypothetical protein
MAWQTPVTTRTSASYYNFADVNRVDNNTDYLVDYISTYLGTSLTLTYNFTTKDNTSFGKASLINGLEENINLLKNYLGYSPVGWQTLNESWTGDSYSFVYTNANNLEVDLSLVKSDVEERVSSLLYCGEALAICGSIPPRF